ncbi:hypothetical protein HT136_16345 [Novosphingobium profundi]|nr:hypothetical protein [Novosphingobium profundi]
MAVPSLALLAACSSTGTYPSLAIREVETRMQAQPAKADAEAAPALPSPDADLTTRLDGLVAVARSANTRFAQKRPAAERAVAASGNRASDAWSAAQIALADLESSRSAAMTALADLDQLYFAARDEAPLETSPKAEAIAAAREQVQGWIADEDAVITKLSGRLSGA